MRLDRAWPCRPSIRCTRSMSRRRRRLLSSCRRSCRTLRCVDCLLCLSYFYSLKKRWSLQALKPTIFWAFLIVSFPCCPSLATIGPQAALTLDTFDVQLLWGFAFFVLNHANILANSRKIATFILNYLYLPCSICRANRPPPPLYSKSGTFRSLYHAGGCVFSFSPIRI